MRHPEQPIPYREKIRHMLMDAVAVSIPIAAVVLFARLTGRIHIGFWIVPLFFFAVWRWSRWYKLWHSVVTSRFNGREKLLVEVAAFEKEFSGRRRYIRFPAWFFCGAGLVIIMVAIFEFDSLPWALVGFILTISYVLMEVVVWLYRKLFPGGKKM